MADKQAIEAKAEEPTVEDAPVDLVEVQQKFYEILGHKQFILYNLYPSMASLKRQLKQWNSESNSDKVQSWTELIWAQRCFVGEANAFGVRAAPIFVFCIYDKKIMNRQVSYPLEMRSTNFSLHTIYRVQKCTKSDADERNCCALFIDEFGRLYEDWTDFIKNNKFNDCLMLAPKNGIYVGHPTTDQVYSDLFHRRGGITKALDITSIVGGLGSAAGLVVGSVATVSFAPAILLSATVAGVACAAYTGGRSIYNLFDRGSHKQTISLKNREARSDWLIIGSGVLMGVTAGTASVVSRMLDKGKDIPKYVQGAVRATQIGVQTIECASGLASIAMKIKKGEDIRLLEWTQLATSVFLWVHSARTLPIKENPMQSTGRGKEKKMRTFLRNQLKAQVRKGETLLKNPAGTLRVIGDVFKKGKEAIIAGEAIIQEFTLSSARSCTEYEPRDDGSIVTAKVEFCRLFDDRVEKMIQKLSGHYSPPQLSALQHTLVNLMCKAHNITIGFIEDVIDDVVRKMNNFVREISSEVAEAIKHILPKISQRLKELLNLKPLSDENYFYKQIHEDIENVSNEHDRITQMHSIEHEEAETIDNDARRIELIMEDRVADKMLFFGDRETELEETITAVYQRLTPEQAEIFFDICKTLIDLCDDDIKAKLGKPIPVDSYISTILLMLCMRNDEDIGSILAPGWSHRVPEFKQEFEAIYTPITDRRRIVVCKKCSGKKCIK